jgi:hypothetical protein
MSTTHSPAWVAARLREAIAETDKLAEQAQDFAVRANLSEVNYAAALGVLLGKVGHLAEQLEDAARAAVGGER